MPDVDDGDQLGELRTRAGVGNLRPFVKGEERTREIARQGVAAREARKAAVRTGTVELAAYLATVRASHDRGALGETAAAVAADVLGRIASGEVKVRHAEDAARLLAVLVDIARMEAGEPTSAAIVAHVNGRDVIARMRELAAERDAIDASSAAVAAAADPEADPPA